MLVQPTRGGGEWAGGTEPWILYIHVILKGKYTLNFYQQTADWFFAGIVYSDHETFLICFFSF